MAKTKEKIMVPGNIEIRDLNAGDEISILELFQEAFGEARSLELWEWRFKKHCAGIGWIALAVLNSKIVGHEGLMRCPLNFQGKKITCAQSVDAMVHPNQQGKGVYTKLATYNQRMAGAQDAEAAFSIFTRINYPGSYPLYIKRLGWKRIMNLKRYSVRIGYKRLWGPKTDTIFKNVFRFFSKIKYMRFFFGRSKDIDIKIYEYLPADCENCLKQIRDYEVLSIWKDMPYFRWRYEDHPEHSYEFHVLRVRGVLEGLLITKTTGYSIQICEVLNRTKNIPQTAALLTKVMEYYSLSSAQIIEFYGYDNGYFDAVFSAAGFKLEPFSPFIFAGKAFRNDKLGEAFLGPHNWSVAYGDGEWV
jgi:hypothetical protein